MFDRLVASAALIVLAPLLLAIAVAVRVSSPGPVLYGATRVGRGGACFTLWKFRTMVHDPSAAGPRVTAAGDRRVTRIGRVLRATKLDELPQLLNVVRGEMRLVGWRPEDPTFFDAADPAQAALLEWHPGITSPASVTHRHEEQTLAAAVAAGGDLEETYRRLARVKAVTDAEYLRRRTLPSDIGVVLGTGRSVLQRARGEADLDLDEVYRGYSRDYPDRWSEDHPGNRAIVEEREVVASKLLGDATAARVLDIGAGSGAGFPGLFPGAFRIDLDVLLWRLLVAGAERRATRKVALMCADGRALPHPDASIDAVLLSVVLSSISPSAGRELLAEVQRVVRPGGSVVIYDMRIRNPRNPAVRAIPRRWVADALPGFSTRSASVTLVPPLARRPSWLRWYDALGRPRVIRTHNVVVGRRCAS